MPARTMRLDHGGPWSCPSGPRGSSKPWCVCRLSGPSDGRIIRNTSICSGITGSPPLPMTKLADCSTIGGYQLDSSMYAVELDREGKLEALRDMIRLTPKCKRL